MLVLLFSNPTLFIYLSLTTLLRNHHFQHRIRHIVCTHLHPFHIYQNHKNIKTNQPHIIFTPTRVSQINEFHPNAPEQYAKPLEFSSTTFAEQKHLLLLLHPMIIIHLQTFPVSRIQRLVTVIPKHTNPIQTQTPKLITHF